MDRHRRAFLAAISAGLTGALAGCGGDGGSDGDGDSDGDGNTGETPTDTSSPTPTATETEAPEQTPTPSPTSTPTQTPTATETGDADQRILVGPGDFVFEPATVSVPVGSTVRWVWESSNHNVKPDSTPDGSDWTGTPGSETFDTGHTYSFTFEVPGEYAYFCQPHRSLGMEGIVTVTE